ncbi:hypothetical protein R1sor_001304 [Riccia sorocarpa]|uniref:Uncharacterized protein n=1 Tax=Riccia sorocarpa TaxID=122646 RepID=A0ABD3GVK2_9MARC
MSTGAPGGDNWDDHTRDLISQLKKFSVASEEVPNSSVVVEKGGGSLFHPKGKTDNDRAATLPYLGQVLLTECFEAVAPVLRISASAKNLSVENPCASVLWDPAAAKLPSVSLEIKSCKLQLPVRFVDLPEASEPPSPIPPSEQANSKKSPTK